MAANEGGGPGAGNDAEANPFSFKTFVKRSGADRGSKAGRKQGGKKKSKGPEAAQDVVTDVPFPEEGGDNPFSFKQFVKKQSKAGDTENTSSSSDSDHSLSSSLDPSLANSHPLSTGPAPTTGAVASITTRHGTKGKSKSTSSSSAIKTSQSFPVPLSSAVTTTAVGKKPKGEKNSLFDDDSDSDSFTTTSTSQDTSLRLPLATTTADHPHPATDPLSLLDEGKKDILKLSDSSDEEEVGRVTGSQGQITSFLSTIDPSQSERLLKQQCSQLGSENKQLKEELERVKEKFKKEKNKNSKLMEQLQTLKKKEADETKALEDMVAKVEENLVASTKRAVSAEATVALLKQELQSLKVQLSQADAQSVHRQYEETLSGVRDKATYASRQLSMAAMAADQSIRELLSGVDTLKNVAELLQFIDRISQVKQH